MREIPRVPHEYRAFLVVRLLLQRNRTAVMIAIMNGHLKVALELIQADANVRAADYVSL